MSYENANLKRLRLSFSRPFYAIERLPTFPRMDIFGARNIENARRLIIFVAFDFDKFHLQWDRHRQRRVQALQHVGHHVEKLVTAFQNSHESHMFSFLQNLRVVVVNLQRVETRLWLRLLI